MSKTLRGLRGATTAAANTGEAILDATAAARGRAAHCWRQRAGHYGAPGGRPGVVSVPSRRGRRLGQALSPPSSEIRVRLLTAGRGRIDATWWADRITAAVRRRAGIP